MSAHGRQGDDTDRPDRRRGGASLPTDAVEPPAQQHPGNTAEVEADRGMAEAEEAVGRHSGSDDQRDSVSAMASERGQEDRRRVWMDRHPDAGA